MTKQQDSVYEIDLLHIFQLLWSRAILILLAGLLAGAAAFSYARFMVTPLYRASVLIYVNNSNISIGSTSVSISSGELTAAQSLVKTYVVILKSRTNLEAVIRESGVPISYDQLKSMISASAVDNTQIFEVSVTSSDRSQAKVLANTIAFVLPDKISDVVDNSSVRIVDYAVTPTSRISPSYVKYTAIGLMLGMFLAAAVIILRDLLDDVIKSEDVITENYKLPVLATIPDLSARGEKYGYYYSYGEKTRKGGED